MSVTPPTQFDQEYQKLNPPQRQAVDTIEGPVMVIAGAGTGKTQTIALRIGNILKRTQISPSNILCLTFTDSAALNMRQRLLSLIGPASYGVRICTFHAFCNSVIKDNPQYFLFSKIESTPQNDASQIHTIRKIIDQLPSTSQLKNLNYTYFYQKDIIRSLKTLKKENISPDRLSELIQLATDFVGLSLPLAKKLTGIRASAKAQKQLVSLIFEHSQNPKLHPLYRSRLDLYLKLFQSKEISLSQLKKSIVDFVDKTAARLSKQNDLLFIYRAYQQTLLDQGLYDYEDMILWVIDAFGRYPELLSQYQEQYHYFFVDEFQDTNSSQYQILDLLIKNQNQPNIFAVGDDDQSIFRFQGASVENVFTFYQRFQNDIKLIILKNNYRSHQLILDSSSSVISQNQNRIAHYIKNIDKTLIASRAQDPDPINLFVASNPLEEAYHIASKIKTLIDQGVPPSEIAVLYRNNLDAYDLMPLLAAHQLKYLLADSTNVLEVFEIQQFLSLFEFIINPQDNFLLAKILSFRFLRLKSADLYTLYGYSKKTATPLIDLIFNQNLLTSLNLSKNTINKIKYFCRSLQKVSKISQNSPADFVFTFVLRRFGFLRWILRHKSLGLLNQLNALYSYLKQSLQSEKISLEQWIQNLKLMSENQLSISCQPLISDLSSSVRLMTVHKAKGLEFQHVFLYQVIEGKWDGAYGRDLISLPLGIVKTDITALVTDANLEEDRRLFYVALTRAKNQIYISYSLYNQSNRPQVPCRFINEIDQKLIEEDKSSPDSQSKSLFSFYTPRPAKLLSADLKGYLNHYLSTQYRFNVTHLNSYLKCPLCFFFKTILRLPQVKNKSLSFGTSVHGVLAYLHQVLISQNKLITKDKFLKVFEQNLYKENLSEKDMADLLAFGRQTLSDYYFRYSHEFNSRCLVEKDFKSYNVRLPRPLSSSTDSIPLTGKIDKLELLGGGTVNVVDYKTGKPDSKYLELSPDGDYFRQLVFYKILCRHAHGFNYQVSSGTIDFIQPNAKGQFVRKNFTLTNQDEARLIGQISDVYDKILSLQFAPTATCPDHDNLHFLSGKYFG